jgi:hypothetical protein
MTFRIPITLFALLVGALCAQAQISPGELSRFHANLEGLTNCTKCHVLGQEVANEKCLECHTVIQSRQTAGRGYHASRDVKGAKCRSCHSEHAGRNFELINWPQGQSTFDHATTGFELEGAHRGKECRVCHRAALLFDHGVTQAKAVNKERTFMGLATSCAECHADEHHGQLSKDCKTCHNQDSWKPATGFDHGKAAYPLTGKHVETDCAKCHAPLQAADAESTSGHVRKHGDVTIYAQYKNLSFANCTPCHQDAHNGKFGITCTECHSTAGFHAIAAGKFDHSKTKYPLDGKHASVTCTKCHKSGDMTVPLKFGACKDCHKDEHGGQFAARADQGACESCHSVQTYLPARYGIEEHQTSKYPLTGSHLAVPCIRCHQPQAGSRTATFTFSDTRCKSCHRDVHGGQLDLWIDKSGCEFCHSTETWHRTSFDHKLSRFPLEGKHREIVCLKCHKVEDDGTGQRKIWIKPLAMECAGCHKDIHQGQFVRTDQGETQANCKRCHSPAGWKTLAFDHNRDAQFKLDGAHAKVACAGCHRTELLTDGSSYQIYKPVKAQCADCHSGNVRGSE